jgi:pimeloyl-ACP methyl ester carboxylesterase
MDIVRFDHSRMRKTIICSHGFAMRADSAGLFTDIEAAFPDYDFKMFDYYDIKPNGDQTIRSLDAQAKILQQQIDDAPDGEIILLCHSQGSTVAGLVSLERVTKVILLAPPIKMSRAGLINRLRHRRGAKLNPYGTSVIPRSDGTVMTIPVEYMDSIEAHDRLELYIALADQKPTTIVRASQDEILGYTDFSIVKNAKIIDIDANHNFTDDSRKLLVETVKTIIG